MNTLDLVLLIGAALFTALGVYWGLIRQVLALVGLLVGVAAAGRYGPEVAGWLSSFVADPTLADAIGFIAVVALVSAVASLIASVLRIFAGLLFLGWLDHLFGGLLGLIQAVLVGTLILVWLVAFPVEGWSEVVAASRLAEPFLYLSGPITALLPDSFASAVRGFLGF